MNRYRTRSELKNLAKDKMLGKYGQAMLVILLMRLITFAAGDIAAFLVPLGGAPGAILSLLVSLLVSFVLGVMNAGIALFFLNAACGRPVAVSSLFYGYREQSNKFLALSAVFSVLHFLCLLPFQIISGYFLSHPADGKWFAATILSWAFGMLVYLPLSLSISQAFYLALDFPELDAKETLKKSIRLMKGHKKRLFFLEISFFPLLLLSLFTCCIGLLWVLPYLYMTETCFFLDLMNPSPSSDR